MSINDEDFSAIECFDAFQELVNKHKFKTKPSEIEAYIKECKYFFQSIYNFGLVDGFNAAIDADNNVNNL